MGKPRQGVTETIRSKSLLHPQPQVSQGAGPVYGVKGTIDSQELCESARGKYTHIAALYKGSYCSLSFPAVKHLAGVGEGVSWGNEESLQCPFSRSSSRRRNEDSVRGLGPGRSWVSVALALLESPFFLLSTSSGCGSISTVDQAKCVRND